MLPDMPTMAEHGLPGFDVSLTYGLVAPAGTPRPIVERLNKALRAALADEAVSSASATKAPSRRRPRREEHAADIDREETRWSTVIKDLGIVGK